MLNVVSNGDFEHLDSGSPYYAPDYSTHPGDHPAAVLVSAQLHRHPSVRTWPPRSPRGQRRDHDGGKTITIHIHPGSTTAHRSTAR